MSLANPLLMQPVRNAGFKLFGRGDLWLGIGLTLVLLAAYYPAWNGKPILDDVIHLPGPHDRSVQGLRHLWTQPRANQQYHPLVDTVFWVEEKLWGESMLGYHLANVLLHATAAFLLFQVLRRLSIPGAWLAAALFALHPVQVESVAYLVELKNTLSGVLLFAAVLAYLRFDEKRDRNSYAMVWLFVVIGLFAKTVTAYLPVCVLLALWWKRGRLERKRDVRPLIPFFAVGILAALATGWMEREFSDAKGAGFQFSPIERLLIAGRAFWFYLAKIFWPNDLMMIYPRWVVDSSSPWPYLFPAAVLLLLLVAWMVHRQHRGLWAGLLFFLLALIPYLGFFNVRLFRYQFVSDHFQYLPIIGIIVPLAAGAALLFDRWRDWRRSTAGGAIGGVLILLTFLTWRHSAAFADAETCYRDSLSKNPNAWLAYGNLGTILLKQGRANEAEPYLRKVLELNPNDPYLLSGIHINLGQVLLRQSHMKEALAHFQESLKLFPDFRAYNSIGSIRHQQGKLREAIDNYEQALALVPNAPIVLTNLAWILATAPDDTLRNGPRALALSLQADALSASADPFFLHTLAAAYAEKGDFPNAIATAQRALRAAEQRQLRDLAAQLRTEIGLYELNLPYRETAM